MVDINNEEIVAGDLIMLTFDRVLHKTAELVVFVEMVERRLKCGTEDDPQYVDTNTLKYYPLNKYGLEVARYDNNVTQADSMFRKTPFTVNNINSANILKMSPLKLNILNKDFYDNITTIM